MKSIISNIARSSVLLILLGVPVASAWAVTGGSISGTLKDASGAVIPGATVTLVNVDLKTTFHVTSDAQGLYSFPVVPVGKYELTIEATGFAPEKKTGLQVDTDSALRIDATLEISGQTETVSVTSSAVAEAVQVDTVQTHLGEVVASTQIAALPLNGRSYTDLLPIQPGVAPITTLKPNSVIMAGVTGAINPSGRFESREPFDRWPARVLQWLHGGRHRRARKHEWRNLHYSQPGFRR